MTTQINGDTGVSAVQDGSVQQSDLAANVVGNGPVFVGANPGSGSITNNTPTKLNLTPNVDTNAYWNAPNNRYVPQVAGYYSVSGKATGQSSTAALQLAEVSIYKNGAPYSTGSYIFGAALANVSDSRSEVSTIVQMNGTTDYIELFGRVVGAGALSVARFEMSIDLVRAA